MKSLIRPAAALAAVGAISAPEAAQACATCFSADTSDPMVQGAQAGILFMVILIYSLLFMMAGVGFMWWRKAVKSAAANPAAAPTGFTAGPSPEPTA